MRQSTPVHDDPDCTGTWEYRYRTEEKGEHKLTFLTGAGCPTCGAEREINTAEDACAFARDNEFSRDLAALSYPGNNHDLAA